MNRIQKILDTGLIDDDVDIQTLEATLGHLNYFIEGLQAQDWGPIGQANLVRYQDLADQVQKRINALHGVDGMTPLTT